MTAIVLDSSALVALFLKESTANWVTEQYNTADRLLMSTVNLAECLMVFQSRKPGDAAFRPERLLNSGIEFIAPNAAQALLAAEARDRYPLNLGDCFAYALAKTHNLPLLTLDRDFRSTDIAIVLPPQP